MRIYKIERSHSINQLVTRTSLSWALQRSPLRLRHRFGSLFSTQNNSWSFRQRSHHIDKPRKSILVTIKFRLSATAIAFAPSAPILLSRNTRNTLNQQIVSRRNLPANSTLANEFLFSVTAIAFAPSSPILLSGFHSQQQTRVSNNHIIKRLNNIGTWSKPTSQIDTWHWRVWFQRFRNRFCAFIINSIVWIRNGESISHSMNKRANEATKPRKQTLDTDAFVLSASAIAFAPSAPMRLSAFKNHQISHLTEQSKQTS